MFKNWSKIVLVSVLVLAMAAPVFASTARVRSLAHTGDYMSDDSNAYRWYSVLPMYANQVNAELGWYNGLGTLSDTRALALNYACGEDGKWGTYRVSLNEHTLDGPGLWAANSFMQGLTPGMAFNLGPATATTPLNKWDVAGGWEVGENFAVGASITRSSWDYESTNPDTTADYSWTTFGVGATWTNNDGFAVDGTFTFGTAGGEASIGGTDPFVYEWDSSTAIEIAGRAFWDWKDYVTVVPTFTFQNAEYSVTDNQDPTTIPDWNGDKFSNFSVGVGLNMDVNSSNMLIFALEVNNWKWELANTGDAAPGFDFDAEVTAKALPTLRLALETAVNSWMTTRIGAVQHLGDVEVIDDDGDEVKAETGSGDFFSDGIGDGFEWTLGIGFNVAEWTIDMELADEAPFSTFYWLTGYSAYIDTFDGPVSRISAIYNF